MDSLFDKNVLWAYMYNTNIKGFCIFSDQISEIQFQIRFKLSFQVEFLAL